MAADFFDTDALMKLLDDHFEGRALNQRKIYTTLTFLIWYKRFFIDEDKGAEVAVMLAKKSAEVTSLQ